MGSGVPRYEEGEVSSSHMSPEQQLMAREMSQPKRIGEVLGAVVGPQSVDKEVTEEAWAIINEHGEGLVLNWQQWPIVQKLVEAGIISGRAGS